MKSRLVVCDRSLVALTPLRLLSADLDPGVREASKPCGATPGG